MTSTVFQIPLLHLLSTDRMKLLHLGRTKLDASKVATDPDIGGDGVTDQSGTGGRFAIVTEADRLAERPHGSVAVTTTSQNLSLWL